MIAGTEPPYTLVAELTYRCPLRCAYCSNPTSASGSEIDADTWLRVIDEAEDLGVVAVHFTGGEPLLFDDLERLVARSRKRGLYTSLVTSGVPLTRDRLAHLADFGLDHVQVSLQSTRPDRGATVAGLDALGDKREVCRWVVDLGVPLTVNFVLHRHNIDEIEDIAAFSEEVGADRLELANAQWLGFALRNRDALLPSAAQIARARDAVNRVRRSRTTGMQIAFILPDHHAGRPRACMDGWARRYLVIAPDGVALPCHAARSLPFPAPSVTDRALSQIWHHDDLFRAFRGDAWMPDTCRSCEHKDRDFGGCRCQAFELTGDPYAVDPACERSPSHALVRGALAEAERPREAALALRRLPMLKHSAR